MAHRDDPAQPGPRLTRRDESYEIAARVTAAAAEMLDKVGVGDEPYIGPDVDGDALAVREADLSYRVVLEAIMRANVPSLADFLREAGPQGWTAERS